MGNTKSSSSGGEAGLAESFRYVDDHRQELLERLVEYLRLPGISAHGTGVRETAEYIAGVMDRLGLESRVLPTAGFPMVLGARDDAPGRPTVLFYGHYDVQPPDPLEEWVSPPFEPTVRDGRLYARGVGDNKGQHFAQLMALEALLSARGRLPCNVKVLLEGEEEVGSPHMPAFVREHERELRSDLVVISDGAVDQSGRSVISFGVRGVLNFELRARGATRDLHSGHWGGVAPNPLWTLVHLLASIKDERGRVTIDGFYDNVRPHSRLEREARERLPVDEGAIKESLGLEEFEAPSARGYAERLTAWPSLTINGVHGGYGGPGSKTVLPHEAVAKCDIRLVEAQTADEIFDRLEAHVRRHAPGVELVRQGSMDPSKTPIDSPFTDPIRRAIVAAGGREPLMWPAGGGSLPQYAFTRTLGIPAFGVPYANPDQANHAPNENLEVERFLLGIKTGVAMMTHLGTR